ncbi:hypothetical protein AYK59_11985 [Pseudomonas synxantha]|uniref:hypothetical protein n=1 Tax=Pseudomonas synxantha TaxID=47883 RepID=UPI0006148BE9|nr:hypothetical protein [Pseudomonas synxantha]AMS20827.1 hypothetical protein AYK59_11985 [Pseudomonas synxantha]
MVESKQHTPKPILRQVVGWVVVLPLLVSFIRLPFPLALLLQTGALVASAYGVKLAWGHATRRVAVFALIVTLLNVASSFMLSTASVLMGLYYISRLYWYPYYSNWVYWNF